MLLDSKRKFLSEHDETDLKTNLFVDSKGIFLKLN